jgi:RNA polymerase-binding transcription factor DksA
MTRTFLPTHDLPHPQLAENLATLREMLHEQREFRLQQLADLTEPSGTDHQSGQGPNPGAQPGDAGHVEVTRALTVAARQALDNVELALERIRSGQYGTCLTCGETISLDRLYVIPQSNQCVDCQRRTDQRR